MRRADSFLPWLRRITANRCRDLLRRAKRRVDPVPLDIELTNDLPTMRSEGFEVTLAQRDVLDAAFDSLTAEQRAVIALHYITDLSIRDVAATLGIPTGTAKSRLNAGLRTLRTELSELEESNDAT